MGNLQAEEYAGQAVELYPALRGADGDAQARALLQLGVLVEAHLTSNHYPPIPKCWVGPVSDFILRWNLKKRIPKSVARPRELIGPGGVKRVVYDRLIKATHLDAFLDRKCPGCGEEGDLDRCPTCGRLLCPNCLKKHGHVVLRGDKGRK